MKMEAWLTLAIANSIYLQHFGEKIQQNQIFLE